MLLDRDEFVVTFNAAKAAEAELIAKVKQAGYTAQVVSGKNKAAELTAARKTLPSGFALLDEAMVKARSENKPLVLDFHAAWCVPCRRMEKTTFVDPRIVALLEQVIFVRVDADQHPDLAGQFDVIGLPDIRLALADGRMVRQLRGFQDAETFAAALNELLRQTKIK